MDPKTLYQYNRIAKKERQIKRLLNSHCDILSKDIEFHVACVIYNNSFSFWYENGNLDRAEKELDDWQAFVNKTFFE